MAGTILEFGDFRLDPDHFELCRAGRPLKLEHKPMELLILLATREGNVVTRAEIIDRLWGSEVFVDTKHGINAAIRKVRHVLDDDPDQPRFVHTVTGHGYRFVGPVVVRLEGTNVEAGREILKQSGLNFIVAETMKDAAEKVVAAAAA